MDLTPYRNLLIFGGTFDPPHNAHVQLPHRVKEVIGADVVVYVPAAQQPLKDRRTSAAKHRLAMLQLAVTEPILTSELDRGGTSYTVDTLAALRSQTHAEAEMRLLIGGDQLRLFDQWRQSERIVELAEPVVMVRPPDTRDLLLDELPAGYAREVWARRLVDVPAMDISSTQIRQRVRAGRPFDELVPKSVADYIQQHRLYAG